VTYPTDWKAIATSVKAMACWRCVRCLRRHSPATGYCLTVHHFDGDPANCELWNLMALCQRCHLSVQNRVDPRRSLLFMPSTWSIPYIAGWYEANPNEPRPPGYDLPAWREEYEATWKPWPYWAPQPKKRHRMSAHTPIPWKARKTDCYSCGGIRSHRGWLIDSPHHIVAFIPHDGHTPAKLEADATLMAAAPDLLEACEALTGIAKIILEECSVHATGTLKLVIDQACSAISKAKGDTP
jgi:hypothetical protein